MDVWMAPHVKGNLNDMLRNIDFSWAGEMELWKGLKSSTCLLVR